LIAILRGSEQPKDYSVRVTENFELFTKWVASSNGDLAAICKGLAKLIVVDVSLNRDQDNPQLIFESMNSTGLDLSQADLIRNYVLMGLEPNLQTRLYEFYWRPMELGFGQNAYATQFDSFIRHYLTVKMGEIPNQREVYETFKQYALESGQDVETLVKDIRTFAGYYSAIALSSEQDKDLRLAFQDIRELKVDTCYPLLLELYHDYAEKLLTKDELLQAARWIESYVFRRAVCDIATNSMNKTFAYFGRNLKKDRYLESIQATFLLLRSYRRFPTDEEFKRDIQLKDIYGLRSKMYFFRRMENHGRKKEPISVEDFTIEHIMPQNDEVSKEWIAELGDDWERVWETYVDTLGNLTLTGYNSEYSDRPFAQKRDMENGFAQSALRLNAGLGSVQRWNEDEICKRALRLATQSLEVWTSPKLPQEILETYRPKIAPGKYTLENHPHLAAGPMRSLYEVLREHILAIDPCVSEEFLKHYIAYKAETNFVDVIPQAKRLRMSLNLAFVEIDDPRGLCRDITTIGRWGNGDVEVGLESVEDLPYVMSLIRQSYDKQMGPPD
jgi:predicted transport protein